MSKRMITPITPTPRLDGRATRRFLDRVEWGLKHSVGWIPTPRLDAAIEKIIADARKRHAKMGSIVR